MVVKEASDGAVSISTATTTFSHATVATTPPAAPTAQNDGAGTTLVKKLPVLVPVLAVGLSDVPGGVVLVNSNTVVYPVGKVLASHSTSGTNSHRVSDPMKEVRSITAIAGSLSCKYIAAAESMSEGMVPQISIFDAVTLDRLAMCAGPRVSSKYTSLCFSGDDTHLLGCGYDDDAKGSVFHLWDWQEGSEPVCSGDTSTALVKATLDPKFISNAVTQSLHEVTLWRRAQAGFRRHAIDNLPKQEGSTFMDHCWTPDGRFIVATSARELLVVERTVCVAVVKVDRPIRSMAAMPDCSLVVAMNKGFVQLFTKAENEQTYAIVAEVQVPENASSMSLDSSVLAMSGETSGQFLACYLKHGPVYLLNMQYAKSSVYHPVQSSDVWEMALPPLHEAAIVSASLAVKKPFIATASKDLTVRVWQHSPLHLVLTHQCHNMPTAVGMDPWGRELVVCYVDGARCYSIVEGMAMETGELKGEYVDEYGRTVQTALDKPSMVKYSPTASMIAVTVGRDILIFSTLSRRQLAQLRGHYAPVQDMTWSDDGLYLVTVADGAVYTWAMDGFSRSQENAAKTYTNDAVSVTPDFHTLVVGDNTQGLRIFTTNRGPPDDVDKMYDRPEAVPPKKGGAWGRGAKSVTMAVGRGGDVSSSQEPVGAAAVVVSDKAKARVTIASVGKLMALAGTSMAAQYADLDLSEDTAGGSKARGVVAVPELKNRCNYTTIMQPSQGALAVAVSPEHRVIISAGVLGRVRTCSLPPRSNDAYQEFYAHSADVRQVLAHCGGQLVFTVDTSGTWMLHVLVPAHQAPNTGRMLRGSLTFRSRSNGRQPSMAGNLDPGAGSPTSRSSGTVAKLTADLAAAASFANITANIANEPSAHIHRTNAALQILTGLGPDGAGGGAGSREDAALHIISIRSVDMQLLKEALREAKDRLAKAASETEYKLYEKEMLVRRQVEGQVGKLKAELTALEAAHKQALAEADAAAMEAARREEEMRQELQRRLGEAQGTYDRKLVYEIDRTHATEKELLRTKAVFGKKLWEVDEDRCKDAKDAAEHATTLESAIAATRINADHSIQKARHQMEVEINIDAEMNEEELARMAEATGRYVEEKEEAYMRLLAKHTLQAGMTNRTVKENAELREQNEQLAAEAKRLTEQCNGLTEELMAMHAAWAERDVRQRQADMEVKDMAFTLQQAQLYTSLATTRINELSNDLVPMKQAKSEAQAQVAKLESIQMRQLERQHHVMLDNTSLSTRLASSLDEVKQLKQEAISREAYWSNFTSQLFQTIHDVPHQQWPSLFGKLYDDFVKGKDKPSWQKYLPTPIQAGAGTSENGEAALESAALVEQGKLLLAKGLVPPEVTSHMEELHAHLVHNEKMISCYKETTHRTEESRRSVASKLIGDNQTLLCELNECRRDLKAAREVVDKQFAELHRLRMLLPASTTAAVAAAVTASTPKGPSPARNASFGANAAVSGGGAGGGLPLSPSGRVSGANIGVSRTSSGSMADPASALHMQHSGQGGAAAAGGDGDGQAGGHHQLSTVYEADAAGSIEAGAGAGTASAEGAAGPPGSLLLSQRSIPPKPGSRLGDPSLSSGRQPAGQSSPTSALSPPSSPPLAGGAPGSSAPALLTGWDAQRPPAVVTGTLPPGGWWLGQDSPFELPNNILLRNSTSAADGAGQAGAARRSHGSVSEQGPWTAATARTPSAANAFPAAMSLSARISSTVPARPGTSPAGHPAAGLSGTSGAGSGSGSPGNRASMASRGSMGSAAPGTPALQPSPLLRLSLTSSHGQRAAAMAAQQQQPQQSRAGEGGDGTAAPGSSGDAGAQGHDTNGSPRDQHQQHSGAAGPAWAQGPGEAPKPFRSAGGTIVPLLPPRAQAGAGSTAGGGVNMSLLQGSLRPVTPSKVTTMGAGFRSFVPKTRANSR